MKSQLSNERQKRTEILAARSAESGEYAFANACRYCDNDGREADENFWTSIFNVALPDKKVMYYFVGQTSSSTACKSICLKYKDYTSPHFVLCIDSDFDFILEDKFPDRPFVFHTVTYSWENHYCWSQQLDALLHGVATECHFNFDNFVTRFSQLIYPCLVKLIAAKRHNIAGWNLDDMCTAMRKQQINKKAMLENDGTNAIALISDDLDWWQRNLSEVPRPLIEAEEIIFLNKGISPSNAYLYMQGHCVYDILERIGRFLCYNTDFDFKTMVLDKNLAIGRYPEILTVVEDIRNQFKQWIY